METSGGDDFLLVVATLKSLRPRAGSAFGREDEQSLASAPLLRRWIPLLLLEPQLLRRLLVEPIPCSVPGIEQGIGRGGGGT